MSSSRLAARRRSSATNLVIPESQADRRVSLTGYSNIVLDVSNNSQLQDEDKNKVRLDIHVTINKMLQKLSTQKISNIMSK